MAAAVVERPIASSAYSFVRFTGGAIAPYIAGKLAENVSAASPMYLGAVMVALSVVTLLLSRRHLQHPAAEAEVIAGPAAPEPGVVLAAIDGTPASAAILDAAERVGRARGRGVHVVHVRETRLVGDEGVELESGQRASTFVDLALERLIRHGITPASGEVLHATGHHAAAADALLERADQIAPSAIVVGRTGAHGGEPGAPSLTTLLVERAPADVVVVAGRARERQKVALT
jgi:nucleotide-binding universal stress UspA family protein